MPPPDAELISRTAGGDQRAFAQLVERHQSAVCGVAYSVVGDFARSEDVAQEAFVAAWQQLPQLREPQKFKSWVCGIARNLALKVVRRESRSHSLAQDTALVATDVSPADQLATREEESLVWRALAGLPETYREPLVLYYREAQSVADVAAALDLSTDAVKQRLSRGRELLRNDLAATIERALANSAPSKVFTLSVMGALAGLSGSSAGAASLVAVAKSAAAPGISVASSGAWLGMFGGLLGAGLGMWFGDRVMRTPSEKQIYRRSLRTVFGILALFMIPFAAMVLFRWNPAAQFGALAYVLALLAWQTALFVALGVWGLHLNWRLKQNALEEAEQEVLSVAEHAQPPDESGRSWTSSRRFLGLPLVDVQFSAPRWPPNRAQRKPQLKFACGWIALGDCACGLVAIGSFAAGGIALGGASIGLLALGGLGIGLFALGGLSLGGVSLGGVAAGGLTLGGVAIGWMALGGAAIAWRAAFGGFALARDFALGGAAIATHANDQAARDFFATSSLMTEAERVLRVLTAQPQSTIAAVVVLLLTIGFVVLLRAIASRPAIARN